MYLIKTSFLKFVQHLENAISMLCTKMKCADCLISWIDFESSLPKLNAQILKTDKMLSGQFLLFVAPSAKYKSFIQWKLTFVQVRRFSAAPPKDFQSLSSHGSSPYLPCVKLYQNSHIHWHSSLLSRGHISICPFSIVSHYCFSPFFYSFLLLFATHPYSMAVSSLAQAATSPRSLKQ